MAFMEEGRSRFFRVAPALIIVISAALAASAWSFRLLEPLDLFFHDLALKIAPNSGNRPKVAVVVIDDEALNEFGWPVTDNRLAEAVKKMIAAGAVVVGIDLYRDTPIPPGDAELSALLSSSTRIVSAMRLPSADQPAVQPPEAVRDRPGSFAATDVPVDPDGVIRRVLLYGSDGERVVPGLAMAIAQKFLAQSGIIATASAEDPTSLDLGAAHLPRLTAPAGPYRQFDDRGYQRLIGFTSEFRDIPRVTLRDVLEPGADLSFAENKAVLIGTISQTVSDRVNLPIRTEGDGTTTSGVILHALAADELIAAAEGLTTTPTTLPEWSSYASIAVTAAVILIAAYAVSSYGLFLAVSAAIVCVVLAVGVGVNASRLFFPAAPMVVFAIISSLGIAGLRYFVLRADQNVLMSFFRTHVSEEVAEAIWQNRDIVGRSQTLSNRLFATVMFVDVSGSTVVADSLEPEKFTSWIGTLHDRLGAVALAHGAFISAFLGDGIMLVFGVPVPRETEADFARDAKDAVSCALEMRSELELINAEYAAAGLPRFRIRIGIHSGWVQAGTIGTTRRRQYTVMGRTPAVAARVEALAKTIPSGQMENQDIRILLTSSTVELYDCPRTLIERGEHRLAGIEQPELIFEVNQEVV